MCSIFHYDYNEVIEFAQAKHILYSLKNTHTQNKFSAETSHTFVAYNG